MNDRIDFWVDQFFSIGSEIAAVRFRFEVNGIPLRKLAEAPSMIDLVFEIFRG